jgi:hypothetical protein
LIGYLAKNIYPTWTKYGILLFAYTFFASGLALQDEVAILISVSDWQICGDHIFILSCFLTITASSKLQQNELFLG